MRGSELEKHLDKMVRELGGFTEKFTSGKRGVPDRICYLPGGKILHVEVKAPGDRLSALQVKWHGNAKKLGIDVHIVCSKQDIDLLLFVS